MTEASHGDNPSEVTFIINNAIIIAPPAAPIAAQGALQAKTDPIQRELARTEETTQRLLGEGKINPELIKKFAAGVRKGLTGN